MKRLYTLASLPLVACCAVCAQDHASTKDFTAVGMSPDGTRVVGYLDKWSLEGSHTGMVWHPATGELEQVTAFDGVNPETGGGFMCINDAGMIGGYARDPEKILKYYDEWAEQLVTMTFREGAIWRDGKKYHLGSGPISAEEFADENDGAYVRAISADGSLAIGTIVIAWMDMGAAVWEYDPAEDCYEYTTPYAPDGARRILLSDMSADGNIIVGTANVAWNDQSVEYPCIWRGLENPEILYPATTSVTTGCSSIAVSRNGRYAAFTFSLAQAAVYDIETSELRLVNAPDGIQTLSVGAVDDNGNFVGQCLLDDGRTYRNLYYSYASDVVTDLGNVLSQLPEPLALPSGMDKAYLTAVSADGNTFLGLASSSAYEPTYVHWLHADLAQATVLPTVTGLKAVSTAPGCYDLLWDKPAEGAMAPKYLHLFVDGESHGAIGGFEYGDKLCWPVEFTDEGSYSVALAAIYEGVGESAPCEPISIYVNLDTELPFFDDCEQTGLNTKEWTLDWTGVEGEILPWGQISGDDYENPSGHLQNLNISSQPFSCSLTSRWLDATGESQVNLSAMLRMDLLNFGGQDLSEDALVFEYTTDGQHWYTLLRMPAADMPLGNWTMADQEIPDVAGKLFCVRMTVSGTGKTNLRWKADNIKIGTKPERKAIEGIRAFESEEGAFVTWPNTAGCYESSRVINSNLLTDYNVGNEGNPIIVAVELPREQTDAYSGMYMRGVAAFIYDNPSVDGFDTEAEVLVWRDGELVARCQSDLVFVEPQSQTLMLDKPLLIEAGHTYRIGVGLTDCDAQQAPIYYQASKDDCIPGVTDLFSEDGGATWQCASEALGETNSRWAVWPLRAQITPAADTAVGDFNPMVLGYNLWREDSGCNNGSQLVQAGFIYTAHPWLMDYDGGHWFDYTLRAYWYDGDMSELGRTDNGSGVEEVTTETPSYTLQGGVLTVPGATRMAVYDLSGRLLAVSSASAVSVASLPAGVYLVVTDLGTVKIDN